MLKNVTNAAWMIVSPLFGGRMSMTSRVPSVGYRDIGAAFPCALQKWLACRACDPIHEKKGREDPEPVWGRGEKT